MKESLLKGINLGSVGAALRANPEDLGKSILAALYLTLESIHPDPNQPRHLRLEDAEEAQALDALATSILQHGVLQPIAVEELERGKYQIIAGERRWRAAKLAQESGQKCARKGYDLSRIPAIIAQSGSSADRLEMQLVENLARADMKDDDVATAVQTLLDTLQVSNRELARRLGRSEGWIRRALATGSSDARQIAGRIRVPLEAVGATEMQRLIAWKTDPDRAYLLDTVAERVQNGTTFARRLLDELDKRHRIESLYPNLKGRNLPLEDLEFVVGHLEDHDPARQARAHRILAGLPESADNGPADSTPAGLSEPSRSVWGGEAAPAPHEVTIGTIREGRVPAESIVQVSITDSARSVEDDAGGNEAKEQEDVYVPVQEPVPERHVGGESGGRNPEEAPDMMVRLPLTLVQRLLTKAAMSVPVYEADAPLVLIALDRLL